MNDKIEVGDTVEAVPRGQREWLRYVVRDIGSVTRYHLEREDVPGLFMGTTWCQLVKKAGRCAHESLLFPLLVRDKTIGGDENPYKFCPWCGVAIKDLVIPVADFIP